MEGNGCVLEHMERGKEGEIPTLTEGQEVGMRRLSIVDLPGT